MALLWLRVAVLLYGVAALAVLPAALYDRPRWRHLAIPAAVAALFFHFVSLAETMAAAHRYLPIDAHETQSVLGLLLVAGFLLVYLRYRTLALGIFVLPISVLLTLVPAFRPGQETLPLAHTGWIILHIVTILAAYAALLVSLLASVLYLVQERRLKRKQTSIRGLPPLETTDQIALKALLFGLPCMTISLFIGSMLAQETVGAVFFRDPKVVLSFVMWVAYCAMIFVRRHSGLRGRRAIYMASFIVFVILTVWAANQFSAVHRFPSP
jgi:ABC-type uncharacterized transport system permease subunit